METFKAPLSQKRRWRKFLNGIWLASPHRKDRLIEVGIEVIIKTIQQAETKYVSKDFEKTGRKKMEADFEKSMKDFGVTFIDVK